MRALYSVLNIPEYVLTELWICLRFLLCKDCENGRVVNMQKLHSVLNMPQYHWICLNRTWIFLNMSEFMITDRVLNIYYTIHRTRSLYKLISTYWQIGILQFSVIFAKGLILDLWKGSEYGSSFKYVNFCWCDRVLNIHNERVMNIPGFDYARFLRMQVLHEVFNSPECGWTMYNGRVSEYVWSKFHRFLNQPLSLNLLERRIWQSYDGKFMNMRGLHRVLSIPE